MSATGRFRVSSPEEFKLQVKDRPEGPESCFKAEVPGLGFLVSYIDLPADRLPTDPNEVLNKRLDADVENHGHKAA